MTNKQVLPVIPVGYRILVEQTLINKTSSSGIILQSDEQAGREQAGHSRGIVRAIGPDSYVGDKFKTGPWCKVGDTIMFPNYAGKKFLASDLTNKTILDDKQFWHVMNDEDVLAVVNEGVE